MSVVGVRRGLVAVTTGMLLAGCSGGSGAEPWGSGGPPASEPTSAEAVGSDEGLGAGLLLTEVGFGPAFVELQNVGPDPVSTAGLSLELDGQPVAVRSGKAALSAGERLVVEDVVVRPDSGVVRLLNAAGDQLDRVAWGEGQIRAVALGAGDFVAEDVGPGATIGRPPGATQVADPSAWVTYAAADATAGAANPAPPVPVLLPVDGAILTGATATLSWYPVPGATSYRVEVAEDESFGSPTLLTSGSDPQVETGELAPGRYLWRVVTVAADGSTSEPSAVSGFELRSDSGTRALADTSGKKLAVPYLVQHKDTAMLLLEEPHENPPMAWDRAHNPPSRFDPADAKNCALAMVTMVNNFYGGDLSQDRIGYELLQDRQPGPEEDLNFGTGLTIEQTNAAFEFALGAPVELIPEFSSYDDAWARITASIDAGRPVAGAGPHHGYVITGYRVEANGHRVMSVNDPANGRQDIDLDGHHTDPANLSLWLVPAHVTARHQEPGVTADSDRDGVVDFDETERFGTDPNDPDSDQDGVRDKQDIVTGVFDEEHGYAFHPDGPGRDWDGDQLATEADPDSDNGQCQDGQEDTSGNGHRNGAETWNFDLTDDACFALSGTLDFSRTGSFDTGPDSASRQWGDTKGKLTVDVELQVDPHDPTALVDAGSSFTVDSVTTSQREVGGDCNPARVIEKSKGTYRFADPPVPSPGHSLSELGDDAHSSISAILDRDRGLLLLQIAPYYPETTEETCNLIEVPGLPIVVDFLTCGDAFGLAGVGLTGVIDDQPTGPDPVDMTCSEEGPSMVWQDEKIEVSGQLKLVSTS